MKITIQLFYIVIVTRWRWFTYADFPLHAGNETDPDQVRSGPRCTGFCPGDRRLCRLRPEYSLFLHSLTSLGHAIRRPCAMSPSSGLKRRHRLTRRASNQTGPAEKQGERLWIYDPIVRGFSIQSMRIERVREERCCFEVLQPNRRNHSNWMPGPLIHPEVELIPQVPHDR